MFDFDDVYLEQRIVLAVFVGARMVDQVVLFVGVEELVTIRLSHHVVEKLTLLESGIKALIRSNYLLNEAKAHESGVFVGEHVLYVRHLHFQVVLFQQIRMRDFVVDVIDVVLVHFVDIRYLQAGGQGLIEVHYLNVAVLIDEIPNASVNFGLLERAKSILLLTECFVFLRLFFKFVMGVGVKMVMTLVVFEIVDRVGRLIMADVVLLFLDVFDDTNLLDDFDLSSHLLKLQSTFFNFVVAEPQGLIVHLLEHSCPELIL